MERKSLSTSEMRLPLRIDEACYLVGALKGAIRNMKQSEEREICNKILDRLKDLYLDLNSYEGLPF